MKNYALTFLFVFLVFCLKAQEKPFVIVNANNEPIAPGKFEPTWQSLSQYKVPDWFRNAKFGIWAHWGPQCEPGMGDWYGRGMYHEGGWQYNSHVQNYGHPSCFYVEFIHRIFLFLIYYRLF